MLILKIDKYGKYVIIVNGDDKMTKKVKQKSWLLPFIGLGAFITYFILSEIEGLPFQLLNIDTSQMPTWIKIVYMIAYEIVFMAIIAFIFRKKLKNDFQEIKKKHKDYYADCFKYWLLGIAIMMVSNVIISMINNGNIANNEETIRQMMNISPIYIFFSAVLFAPLVEELVFRQGFRFIFSNNILFIFMSAFVFGGLHVFTSMESLVDLLYIIPYGAPGAVFAYMLVKTDNIFVPMGFHFMHNGILVALQILLLFLA